MAETNELLASLTPPEIRFSPAADDEFDSAIVTSQLTKVLTASPWIRVSDHSPVSCAFVLVERESPTAFAVEALPCRNLIAIHSGLLQVLMNVFARVAHHDAMFREVEKTGLHDRQSLFENNSHRSNEPNKMLLATLLYRLSVEFLFYHELHHLLLGHAGYVSSKKRASRLYESGPSPFDDVACQRPMEYAADLHASKTLYDSVMARRFALFTPASLEGLETQHLVYASVVAFTTLFCTLQYHDSRANFAYPSVCARSLTFINEWTRLVERDNSLPEDLWDHSSSTALRTVRTAFSEIYDDVELLSFIDDAAAIDRSFDELVQLATDATGQLPIWHPFSIRTCPRPIPGT